MRVQACRAEADGRSLVLLDELGTGTDPVEGAALGVALLKRMAAGELTTDHSHALAFSFPPRVLGGSLLKCVAAGGAGRVVGSVAQQAARKAVVGCQEVGAPL